MKHNASLTLLLTAVLALAPGMSHATDDFAQGDLALIFYKLTGDAPGNFIPEYYAVNLGPVSAFRANTQNNVSVKTVNPSISSSNIAEDLNSVFGLEWADEGTVQMMAVTTISASAGPIMGDPARTIYFSGARTSLNTDQKGFDPATPFTAYQGNPDSGTLGQTLRSGVSGKISGFIYDGVNIAITAPASDGSNPPGANNPSGARLAASQQNSLKAYVPNGTQSAGYFGLGASPVAVLGEGKLPGTANVEAAVDIFRLIYTLTDATLTSGSSSGNAVVGQGQYIGSITLDAAGELKVQAVGIAAPPTGGYASWATTNNVTGGTTGDSDNDGISNLTEYALALNPAASDGAAGTYASGTVSFTKRPEAVTNNDITYAIQESDDLGVTDAWATVTATTDTTSQISYTLPAGSAKKFARLLVTKVP